MTTRKQMAWVRKVAREKFGALPRVHPTLKENNVDVLVADRWLGETLEVRFSFPTRERAVEFSEYFRARRVSALNPPIQAHLVVDDAGEGGSNA